MWTYFFVMSGLDGDKHSFNSSLMSKGDGDIRNPSHYLARTASDCVLDDQPVMALLMMNSGIILQQIFQSVSFRSFLKLMSEMVCFINALEQLQCWERDWWTPGINYNLTMQSHNSRLSSLHLQVESKAHFCPGYMYIISQRHIRS